VIRDYRNGQAPSIRAERLECGVFTAAFGRRISYPLTRPPIPNRKTFLLDNPLGAAQPRIHESGQPAKINA
jgi:hypothetical protein